jgi:hypothetical protein
MKFDVEGKVKWELLGCTHRSNPHGFCLLRPVRRFRLLHSVVQFDLYRCAYSLAVETYKVLIPVRWSEMSKDCNESDQCIDVFNLGPCEEFRKYICALKVLCRYLT